MLRDHSICLWIVNSEQKNTQIKIYFQFFLLHLMNWSIPVRDDLTNESVIQIWKNIFKIELRLDLDNLILENKKPNPKERFYSKSRTKLIIKWSFPRNEMLTCRKKDITVILFAQTVKIHRWKLIDQ